MFGVSELCEGAVLTNWALCGRVGGEFPGLAPQSLWILNGCTFKMTTFVLSRGGDFSGALLTRSGTSSRALFT